MRAIPDLPVSNPAGFVLHVLTDGVLTHDVTGRIVKWNEAASRILRVADDALGASSANPLWHAVHADGSPWPIETQPAQLTLYQGIQVHDETMGIRQPDGTFTWLRVISSRTSSSKRRSGLEAPSDISGWARATK